MDDTGKLEEELCYWRGMALEFAARIGTQDAVDEMKRALEGRVRQPGSQDKKKYLRQYRDVQLTIRHISQEILQLEKEAAGLGASPDGDGTGEASEYSSRIGQLMDRLAGAKSRRVALCDRIMERIDALGDEVEKQVLLLHYIRGLKWDEVAGLLGFSRQHINRLHGNALKNLSI